MWRYIELLSLSSFEQINPWKKRINEGENPKNIKVEFAKEIVERFYDKKSAQKAEDNFNIRAKGDVPEDIEEHLISITELDDLNIRQLLKKINLVTSTSEAFRLIKGGGVKINGKKIVNSKFNINKSKTFIIQVGKRKFAKINTK